MEIIRTTSSCTQKLEDVPELIHRIRSLLRAKEAAQTCILSKSWLNAWSTIPALRFPQPVMYGEQETYYAKLVDSTLARYHLCNLPIQSFDLHFHIWNQNLASLANKWILSVASRSALKELFLRIWVGTDSFTLPDEIFSSANLNSMIISASDVTMTNPLWIPHNPVILCASLRVLELKHLNISEDVLHNLFSICSLLEKINLYCCDGFKTIKLKNLRCLRELKITSLEENDVLEIDDVPSLQLFHYNSLLHSWKKPPFNMGSLGSVTHLDISGVVMDDAFFYMFKSKFPFLESLSLGIAFRGLESIVITSLPLKSLTLRLLLLGMTIDVKVYALKLQIFLYDCEETVPSLSFPTIAPEQIKLKLNLHGTIDHSFFVKMSEALNLSSKFDIDIIDFSHDTLVSLNIEEIDDLRRRVTFPATNVGQLSLLTVSNERLWEHTRFFDAFFSICHPSYVTAGHIKEGNKCFSKLIVEEMMKKKTTGLDVELKNPRNGKWEDLTRSCEKSRDNRFVEFKLNWFSM